jgi:hypothetical protein
MSTDLAPITVLVPAETLKTVRRLAGESERSIAAEVRLALRAWVDAAKLENGKRPV